MALIEDMFSGGSQKQIFFEIFFQTDDLKVIISGPFLRTPRHNLGYQKPGRYNCFSYKSCKDITVVNKSKQIQP